MLRSDLLGDTIKLHHGDNVFDKVKKLRNIVKQSRSNISGVLEERLTPIANFVSPLSSKELVVISRVFIHFWGVANAAEAHQRCRWLKMDLTTEGLLGALHKNKRDSTGGVLTHYLGRQATEVMRGK